MGISLLAREVLQAASSFVRIQNGLKSATGSAQQAGQEFGFVREESLRLGLDLEKSAQGFMGLAAAARGTSLAGEAAREIFLGVSEASTALGLTAEQSSGALQAVSQMISKGTVAAEELRGQLGERLPGAFQIAARATGVTTQELGKMLEQGQLLANDFLPRFAAELRKTFGRDAAQGAESLQAQMQRFKTSLFELKLAAAQAGLTDLFKSGLREASDLALALAKNEDALLAVGAAAKVAAFAIGTVGAQMAAAHLWTASVGLFGAAWLKTAADAGAAAGLIATATASMAASVTALATLGASGIWTVVESFRTLNSQKFENDSLKKLGEQAVELREALEERIAMKVSLGEISPEQAAKFKADIQRKFDQTADPVIRAQVLNMVREQILPSAAPSGPAGSSVPAEQKQALEEIGKLRSQLQIETLSGIDRERWANAEAAREREAQIESLAKKARLPADKKEELLALSDDAFRTEDDAIKGKQNDQRQQKLEEFRRLQEQGHIETLSGFDRERAQADQVFSERLARIEALKEAKIASVAEQEQAEDEAFLAWKTQQDEITVREQEQANARRKANEDTNREAQRLEEQFRLSLSSGRERELREIEMQFRERQEMIDQLYGLEAGRAQELSDLNRQLRDQQIQNLEEMSAAAQATMDIAVRSMIMFADGMSGAIVDFVSGTKTAEEAFKEFAAQFMQDVARMIIRYMLLLAIQSALGGVFGASSGVFQGFTKMAGLAEGGSVPRKMAAGGFAGPQPVASVPGVSEVTQATFFPGFDAIAGEAGREVLTVLAQPRQVNLNGLSAVVGNAGADRVAMVNADDLMKLSAPARMMADGGFAGAFPEMPQSRGFQNSPAAPAAPAPVIQSRSLLSGHAVLDVRLAPGLVSEITRDAIDGAELRVTQAMQSDSSLSRATRGLVS